MGVDMKRLVKRISSTESWMKVAIEIFLISFLLLIPALIFSEPQDVTGYRNITWGDSIQKVRDLYYNVSSKIDYYEIGEFPYNAIQYLDKSSPIDEFDVYYYLNQAFRVGVIFKDRAANDPNFFDILSKRLVRDFGANFTEKSENRTVPGGAGVSTDRTWNFKSTVITLTWVKGSRNGVNFGPVINSLYFTSIKMQDQIAADKEAAFESMIIY